MTKYTEEQLKQTGIYAIIHRESGKIYIGSAGRSFKHRWSLHKSDLRKGKHHSTHLQNAWNKYTEFAFDFVILEVVPKEEWTDNRYLLDIEQMWLDSYQSYDPNKGYNICSTAGSPLGVKRSEETRRKMSLARNPSGITSERNRRKLAEENRDVQRTKATRENIFKAIKTLIAEDRKVTQRAVAELIGVSQALVNKHSDLLQKDS